MKLPFLSFNLIYCPCFDLENASLTLFFLNLGLDDADITDKNVQASVLCACTQAAVRKRQDLGRAKP